MFRMQMVTIAVTWHGMDEAARWPLFEYGWSLGRDIEMQVWITAGMRYGTDETAITGMQRWDVDGCWATMLECK